MLKQLVVKDFQSIRHVALDVGKYTVLVGKSNSGKSAMLRALNTLIRNSFIPAYVRAGATNAGISATFSEGTVQTIRGKESTYILNDEKYTKCGREVPTDVASFIRMPLVAKEDIYFTTQFDTPFLVSGKSTTASAVVGTITNVVTVQTLAQETNKKRLQSSQLLATREGDLETLEADLSAYDDLPTLEGALARLRLAADDLEALKRDAQGLEGLIDQHAQVRSQIKKLPNVPNLNPDCFDQLATLHKDVETLESLLQRAAEVPTVTVPPDLRTDADQLDVLKELEEDVAELERLIARVHEAKSQYHQTLLRFDTAGIQVVQLQKELEQLPVCEMCGREF